MFKNFVNLINKLLNLALSDLLFVIETAWYNSQKFSIKNESEGACQFVGLLLRSCSQNSGGHLNIHESLLKNTCIYNVESNIK